MADIVTPERISDELEDTASDIYSAYRDDQEIPYYTGLFVKDVGALETGRWERTGQDGALVNLYGSRGITDLQIHDIAPGEKTDEQHHFYEQTIYVETGSGATAVGRGDNRVNFEWTENSLFFLPRGVPYTHFNLSEKETVRLVSVTPLPLYLTLFQDREFVCSPSVNMWDQYYETDYFESEDSIYERGGGRRHYIWETNFVSDIASFDDLQQHKDKLGEGNYVFFEPAHTTMFAHIGEIPKGKYKTAHRHAPGAHVLALSGSGYSLMWRERWDKKVRMDWGSGSVFVPPTRWYHHHFNTSPEPARTFALHKPDIGTLGESPAFDPFNRENIIGYEEEDPEISALFAQELADTDITSRMN